MKSRTQMQVNIIHETDYTTTTRRKIRLCLITQQALEIREQRFGLMTEKGWQHVKIFKRLSFKSKLRRRVGRRASSQGSSKSSSDFTASFYCTQSSHHHRLAKVMALAGHSTCMSFSLLRNDDDNVNAILLLLLLWERVLRGLRVVVVLPSFRSAVRRGGRRVFFISLFLLDSLQHPEKRCAAKRTV